MLLLYKLIVFYRDFGHWEMSDQGMCSDIYIQPINACYVIWNFRGKRSFFIAALTFMIQSYISSQKIV